MTAALKLIAFIVGLALLAATAHVTIESTGGYGTPHAVLTMASGRRGNWCAGHRWRIRGRADGSGVVAGSGDHCWRALWRLYDGRTSDHWTRGTAGASEAGAGGVRQSPPARPEGRGRLCGGSTHLTPSTDRPGRKNGCGRRCNREVGGARMPRELPATVASASGRGRRRSCCCTLRDPGLSHRARGTSGGRARRVGRDQASLVVHAHAGPYRHSTVGARPRSIDTWVDGSKWSRRWSAGLRGPSPAR